MSGQSWIAASADPYQQSLAGRSVRPKLAHRRMAAEICPGAERHRAVLARSERPLPRSSDLRRRRSSRPRYPSRYCRHEPGAPITDVYQPTNRCLVAMVLGLLAERVGGRVERLE